MRLFVLSEMRQRVSERLIKFSEQGVQWDDLAASWLRTTLFTGATNNPICRV
jgi:hypothetical protein